VTSAQITEGTIAEITMRLNSTYADEARVRVIVETEDEDPSVSLLVEKLATEHAERDDAGTDSARSRARESDNALIRQWLHGRPANTQMAYARDVSGLLAFVSVDLKQVTLSMLQAWVDSDELAGAAPASLGRAIAAVKSLFSFANRQGYLAFDAAAALRRPRIKTHLAERILPESDMRRILRLEMGKRNNVLLRVLYASGLRVSEICELTWVDCQPRRDGSGQITVFGKAGKTRSILLPRTVWDRLETLRTAASKPSAPDAHSPH
jgi:site-specific recombinase XerD